MPDLRFISTRAVRKGSEPFHGIQGPRRRGYAGALAPALLLPWVFLAALKGFYLLEYTGRVRRLAPPPPIQNSFLGPWNSSKLFSYSVINEGVYFSEQPLRIYDKTQKPIHSVKTTYRTTLSKLFKYNKNDLF